MEKSDNETIKTITKNEGELGFLNLLIIIL
jgi:hypothetical protein